MKLTEAKNQCDHQTKVNLLLYGRRLLVSSAHVCIQTEL